MNRFLTLIELAAAGFKSIGTDVFIDRSAVILNPGNITIGSRVRIDAFALIIAGSDGIFLGSDVHLGASTQLFANSAAIQIEDFSGTSPRATLFTATDDFVEGFLTGPTVPLKYRKVEAAPIILKKHSTVGAASVVLPGVTIGWGATVGALSLVRKSVPDLHCVFGSPARQVATRSRELLERLEREYLAELIALSDDRSV